jgi:ectoine hydroxylase-related dioxygenase (phytanoyl-CoA dioxygenase family)
MPTHLQTIMDRDGFAVLRGALSPQSVDEILKDLMPALEDADESAGPLRAAGTVAASRNLLQLCPSIVALARKASIRLAVSELLGPQCGLVRALYFDKPPERSWSLPWHRDMTIAVREHRSGDSQFSKPTRKGGVPHVEAPESVLREMVTARVHLDDVTDENGPLLVIPGSHCEGKGASSVADESRVHAVLVEAGDVLLMRPLLMHCSRKSQPGVQRRRRIVHLEFARQPWLADGFEWHDFHSLSPPPRLGVSARHHR